MWVLLAQKFGKLLIYLIGIPIIVAATVPNKAKSFSSRLVALILSRFARDVGDAPSPPLSPVFPGDRARIYLDIF